MPRLPRICPAGIPQHLIQRGHNHQICFASNSDFATYCYYLKETSKKYGVDIHAWILMTNHIHLLATPKTDTSISKMMQTLGRKYVCYYNKKYQRSGTLWGGRFKSCLVQSSRYLLLCYRYIELNPVRALMVNDPALYHWSSYQCNAMGKQSELITSHSEYLQLGRDRQERLESYRELFNDYLSNNVITEIRESINKNMAFANDTFKNQIELTLKRRVRSIKPGRKNEVEI